jgi:SAM-dependent methyltransferase
MRGRMYGDHVRLHYDRVSTSYGSSFGNRSGRASERRYALLSQLALRHAGACGAPALELGCGTGLYSVHLRRFLGERHLGLDISGCMLRQAREAGCRALVQGDARHLPFRNGSLSMVWGFGVLHHVAGTQQVFHEVARILPTGGLFVLMEPRRLNPVNLVLAVFKRIERGMLFSSQKRWRNEATIAGLELAACRKAAFLPAGPVFMARVLDRIETILESIPVIRNLAIFDMLVFKKRILPPAHAGAGSGG